MESSRTTSGAPELLPMDQVGPPEAALPASEVRHDGAVPACAEAVAGVGLVGREVEHPEPADEQVPDDPLLAARRRLYSPGGAYHRVGMTPTDRRIADRTGYDPEVSPIGDRRPHTGGMGSVSTHGTPRP